LVSDRRKPGRKVRIRRFRRFSQIWLHIGPAEGCSRLPRSTIFTEFTSWCYTWSVKRTTVTIPRDLEAELESYLKRQDVRPALTAVVQAALREYLANRSYIPPTKPLRITPARKGSGLRDVSLNHDRYFAER
jgi:hypothetical protein